MRINNEYKYYQDDLDSKTHDYEKYDLYFQNTFITRNHLDWIVIPYSIISSLIWLRVIVLFKLTRFLGPLVKMIQNMIYDIGIFMILFVTQLIVFGSVGTLLFVDVSDYSNLYDACKTLFNASLGNYDFTVFADCDRGQTFGDVYLFIFIVLNAILLLNLLIAVLSSTYANLEEKKLVLYINEILHLRSSLEYNENYS